MRIIAVVVVCLVVIVAFIGTRVFLLAWFVQPSASMEPTVREGDSILVNKAAYGWPHDWIGVDPPSGAPRHGFHAPQRGDLVTFRWPHDGHTIYFKRLIGLPGERIQLRQGVVYVNGKALAQRSLGIHTSRDHCPEPRNACPALERVGWFEEVTPEGRRYVIQDHGPGMPADDTGVYVVPPHCYFVLGDNRDNSADSRFDPQLPPGDPKLGGCAWDERLDAGFGDLGVGFVPEDYLMGRVDKIFN